MSVIGAERRSDAYNILRPYCELPQAPEKWRPLLNNVSEIWSPTQFIAEAFRAIFPGPITIVPPCVDVHAEVSYDRSHFNLTEEVFYFMCSFDYYSTPARKNPLGVVAAFQEAFPPQSGVRVGLVVKSVGPTELSKRVKMKLDKFVRDDPRIVLIEGSVSRDEMLSLLGCVDCYVSLHRSEGFGLGMAESLAMAKPVIGTSYSGNVDFLNAETGFPVGYTLRRLRDGEYYDGDGQIWAEPDTSAAVQAMRIVVEDARAREKRGQRGRELMQSVYGSKNVARVVVERLEDIRLSRK
jgi:glycosyltransferase involved in cell wall biosynthesis